MQWTDRTPQLLLVCLEIVHVPNLMLFTCHMGSPLIMQGLHCEGPADAREQGSSFHPLFDTRRRLECSESARDLCLHSPLC